jgi:hypothetical protein
MNAQAKPWIALTFTCLSVLSLLFAFIFFMRLNEETTQHKRYVEEGVVSRAIVVEKNLDTATYQRSKGRSTTVNLKIVRVRHVQKSLVKFQDFPNKVSKAQLPAAPPISGDFRIEMDFNGLMFVSSELYNRVSPGDELIVVNTPYEPSSPVLVDDVRAFSPAVFYPRIAIALLLTIAFWFVGRRFAPKKVKT